MKVRVATSERDEPRLSPHTPWPLVQPLPSAVPNPTSRPPVEVLEDRGFGEEVLGMVPEAILRAAGVVRSVKVRARKS